MLVVLRGLQNRCGGLGTSQVGSIPTYSRQKMTAEFQRSFFTAYLVELQFQLQESHADLKKFVQIHGLFANDGVM